MKPATDLHLKTARYIAKIMDKAVTVGPISVGLDSIFGILPIGGDLIGLLFSGYLIWIAQRFKLPPVKINRMWFNVAIDFVIGSIPLIGDIGDIFFKANLKNLKIIEDHLSARTKLTASD